MRKILISVFSGFLALLTGSGVALGQDQELVSKVVPVEVWTCNYKEGHGPTDIDAATDAWNGYMDENNVDSYAAWTLTKSYYGPDQEFDVIWLGAWTDGNAMGTASDMMAETGGEYLAKFFVALDCATHSNLASLNYKLPGDGTINTVCSQSQTVPLKTTSVMTRSPPQPVHGPMY